MTSIPVSAEDCYACVKMTKPCPYNHEEPCSEPVATSAAYRFVVDEAEFNEVYESTHEKKPKPGDYAKFCEKFCEINTCRITEWFAEEVNNIIAGNLNEASSDESEASSGESNDASGVIRCDACAT